ncbi:hypothetical protein BDY17DRAFT_319187 [Neohortaea acidophila]|uniref:BRCA1-associated protein 2-domain-containing protein n=1 Tax=Neohortaea acidophila TaxID=245834 RepID=A0A6A6PGT8_9PEZI|nr:uncharacterized protein BDY17DRAFT_319187 [Neohortaea acidophila]KAF2479202.1 hypothetical protein BDY17DRAFT_319187 [Neohortaea acidophila]
MYFFHLKLELYQAPAAAKLHLAQPPAARTVHVPPPGADIFRTALPAHKTTKWSSHTFTDRPETPSHSLSSSISSHSPKRSSLSEYPDSHGNALLLPERTAARKDVPKSPALIPVKPSNDAAARDWRYDRVSIESIDMQSQKAGGAASTAGNIRAKSGAIGLHTKAVYTPSEPKTTEVGWGVVHLYRDSEESGLVDTKPAMSGRKSVDEAGSEQFDPDECSTLCIVAVPSWMMPSDLLGFVGDQAREDVSHFRLIRTGRTNKYMVLMKFRSARKARDWQKAYNGRLFSVAEPENCHVVFVKSVEFLNTGVDEHDNTFPQNNHDPFTPTHPSGQASRTEKSLSSKPFAPPPPNLLELPTCPVCLERMDETTGLLTILCQHVFHCACLEKWRFTGSGCPVCRYTQNPSHTFPFPRPSHSAGGSEDAEPEPLCSVCATNENVGLWICLICGNIGCGRYDSAHAYAHYEATSHCYAMDINTQRVWDYAGDGYVHRLIQSKPDFTSQQTTKHSGSAVDASNDGRKRHANEAYRAESDDVVPREKMESMANEYAYLLTSQLEGQRRYFEEQVERAVDKASQATAKADAATVLANSALADMKSSKAERDSFEAVTARLEAALEKAEKSKVKFEKLARDLSAQLREEKTMNEGLMKRITAADEKAAAARTEAEKAREEKRELEEMNHDLTMFISSQEKVKELQAQGEEVVDGSVSLPPAKKGKGRKK